MTLFGVPKKWDDESDIIIVGAGNAGLPAAITATDKGAEVTVLEVWSGSASSLAMIAGGTPFAGTDLQRARGIEDSSDRLFKEAVEISGGSRELWRAIADRQLETYEWLKSIGAKPDALLWGPGHGVMRSVKFEGGGAGTLKVLRKAAQDRGIEILVRHRAERLIRNPENGRIIGIGAKHGDKGLYFRARKAVILATGGFSRNEDLVKEYGPEYVECMPVAPPTHMGDGLKMALAVGAATDGIGLAVTPSMPACVGTGHMVTMMGWGGIHVKRDGQRWGDEMASATRAYNLIYRTLLQQDPSGDLFVIYDDRIRREAPPEHYRHNKEYSADTVEELAKILSLSPEALKATIDEYNSDIEKYGYDRQFGRTKRGLADLNESPVKLDTPPFYGIKCKVCTSSMKGGVKINAKAQVIDQFGYVMPGLYAAGEVAGGLEGIPGHYYTGAMTISAFVFGRVAGENAAAEVTG